MRRDRVKKGLERVPHRALLYAVGLDKKRLGKPFIGIASAFTDLIPGHTHLRLLERSVEQVIKSLSKPSAMQSMLEPEEVWIWPLSLKSRGKSPHQQLLQSTRLDS